MGQVRHTVGICGVVWALAVVVEGALPQAWVKVCGVYDPAVGDQRGACPVPPRAHATLIVEYDSVHVFGGTSGVAPRSDLWTYSIVDEAWTQDALDWRETTADWASLVCTAAPPPDAHVSGPARAPLPRVDGAMFHDTSELLFFGGGACRQAPSYGDVPVWDFWYYARLTARWAHVDSSPELPKVRGAASVIWSRKLFVFFGQQVDPPCGYTNTIESTDMVSAPGAPPPRWHRVLARPHVGEDGVPEMPAPRALHTCVLSGDEVFVFGGRNDTAAFNDIWSYNLLHAAWRRIDLYAPNAKRPQPRFSHSTAVCHNTAADKSDVILLFGGSDIFGDLLADTWAYGIGQHSWFLLDATDPPPKRMGAAMHCSREGQVWLFGGEPGIPNKTLNDFYTLF